MKSDDPEHLGVLECPGGRVDKEELIQDTMKRELKEEIDLDLDSISHDIQLFALNQRDAIEYDWDDKTQIVEAYYKVTIPNDVEFHLKPLVETDELIWIDKDTDLDTFSYWVQSRKDVYKQAQESL